MCSEYEPCLNGGTCSNFSGGYNCTCAAGWTGENCDQEINHCSSQPCHNSGICYNLVDQYYCQWVLVTSWLLHGDQYFCCIYLFSGKAETNGLLQNPDK